MRRLNKYKRPIAVFLFILFLSDLVCPTVALALTGGPSQPEVQSFEPAGTEQMVEPFSGDFVYNIPLLDVGGYPINISYHSGITMDQEASWVGLGWNINPGVINRNVRGLPDDFSGDPISKDYNVKKDWTAGVNLGAGLEMVGFDFGGAGGSINMGVFYNSYKGVGFEGGTSFSYKIPLMNLKGDKTSGLGLNLSLGLNFNSQSGIDVSPSCGLSFTKKDEKSPTASESIGASYNSRVGLASITYSTHGRTGGMVSGGSSSMAISFISQPVTPTIDFPMVNFGFSALLKLGGTLELAAGDIHISGNIKGSYSEQKLKYRREILPGYGYINMDRAGMDPRALLDFNREKDQPFRKPNRKSGDEGTPVMAIPSYGYDLFAVSGQGVSGQYRSMRSEIGSVYDPATDATSGSGSAGIDIGLGQYATIGVDLSFSVVLSKNSQWKGGNDVFDRLSFKGYNNTLYEPAGFINSGEKVINDETFYQAIGGEDPVRIKLNNDWFSVKTLHWLERFKNKQEREGMPLLTAQKNKRLKRNQVFSYLTAEEGKVGALQEYIQSYPFNEFPTGMCGQSSVAIKNTERIVHSEGRRRHMTEVTVLNADGNRYVYGIPAYNRVKKDLTFSVSYNSGANPSGVTSYTAEDNSLENKKGLENYYSAETVPAYSHSFLLTAILSPDYVDLTGDGPTADDLGTSVRINYSRAYGGSKLIIREGKLYKWRVPYERNKGNYQEGFKSDPDDDKANYMYGEKEVYYMHSIESKTMVALCKVSDREDGLGVIDENGGKNVSAKLKKLDAIELYAKSDLLQNSTNAVPLKTVHFNYSYKLCPNVENNTGAVVVENGTDINANHGKLTLEKVFFTYQRNRKGKLSPYVFSYDMANNPSYHLKHQDRWGNYKVNDSNTTATEAEYPYTPQDKTKADNYAKSWSLNKITLPTGGVINIEAEADDYAYVQDKRAMQMFQIAGLGNTSTYSESNQLYTTSTPQFNDPNKHNEYVYIKIPSTGTPLTHGEIARRYFEGVENLYYRCAVKMYPNHDKQAEYVPGYCKIDGFGACPGRTDMIWIKLQQVPLGNDGAEIVNPITKTAWQFLRINLPFLAYPGSQTNDGDFLSVIKALIAPLFDIQNMFKGFSRACMTRHWCQSIILNRSWIRLDNPNYCKYGGGARIKSLTISDSWDRMISGEMQATYGQVYDYTTTNGKGETISSGVAEYEPMLGQDENPHRQPLIYRQKTKLAPHSQFWIETPVGESFYPAATVGYRQVKVRSYGSTLADVPTDKRTGHTIKTFYTAYDFPVTNDYTPMLHRLHKIPSIIQLLQLPMAEHFTASQGFQIELNDMHGKPRSEEVYNNEGGIVSKTVYNYKVDNPTSFKKHLNNDVQVLMPDGTVKTGSVGKDIELMTDNRHQETMAFNGGVMLQLDLSKIIPVPPVPGPLITFFPVLGFEETQFRSLSTMKTVRRFGILESTTVQQYGSTVTTTNKVFDSETGEVVLTETDNEFDDKVYNFTYPAHLAYDGMGPAYKNIGAEFTRVKIENGRIVTPTSIEQYFAAGDEIIAKGRPGVTESIKLWVIDPHHTNPEKQHQTVFITENGAPFHSPFGTYTLKIMRSGRRNMASIPVATLTSLHKPIHADTLGPEVTDMIVNTSVTEFKDDWKINCDKITTAERDSCQKPTCSCMHDLLRFIASNNHWAAVPEDSVFINLCCMDSCFYSNGEPSTDGCSGCMRHIYADDGQSLTASVYVMHVGRCTLKITREDEFLGVWALARRVDSLRVLKCSDVVIMDSACTTVGNYYDENNLYPLINISSSGAPVHYTAQLICESQSRQICVDLSPDSIINPYRYGLLGNWRPYRQWAYRGMRTPGSIAYDGATNIRTDGVFSTYEKFWVYNNAEAKYVKHPSLSAKYIDATTMTKYNSKGADIENRDAAGIYSSALYGYLETQAIAVAKNARYKQIGFDHFEDYLFATDCASPCRVDHFNFRDGLVNGCMTHCGELDSVAHSGVYSLKVLASGPGQVTMTRDLKPDYDGSGIQLNVDSNAYYLKPEGCLPKFSPDTGIRYFASAWVREAQNCNALQYENAVLRITFDGDTSTINMVPSGNIIEGWQRIEGTFNIPTSATAISVACVGLNGTDVNFDDIRVQPFNSSMKTYVYDWKSLRLMCQLDENNYGTFYEYNDEGTLVRVKKETERGIMTIQETRSVLKRK